MKKRNTQIKSGTNSVGKKIIYHDPPMKYNVALHKFEVNLPTIKRKDSKEDVQDSGVTITIILVIFLLIAILYFISKI